MKRKEVDAMDVQTFMGLPYESQVEFIETCKADFDVVTDLIRDRKVYQRVIDKLIKQLERNGLTPCTSYNVEVFKNSNL